MLITDAVAWLLQQQPVTALVGDHVWPIPAPVDMSQYPLITYQSPSYIPQYASGGSVGVSTTRMVFDCKAYNSQTPAYLAARTIAETLAETLSGFTGVMGTTKIFETEIANIVDGWDDGSKVSCTTVHAIFTYSE